MTTHPHAQLLRDAYDAVGRGDLGPMLALLHEDAIWTDSTLGPLAGAYRKDEVPRFFATMMEVYRGTLRVEIESIVADEQHGVVLTRETGVVEDCPVAWTSAHVYTFEHGAVRGFANYGSAEYQRFWAARHTTAG